MNDGHSGVENKQVNEGGSGGFQLVLAALKHGSGQIDFVIHAQTNRFYDVSLNPEEFLENIGLTSYPGQCPFFDTKCFYKVIGVLERDIHGYSNSRQVSIVHNNFKSFTEQIDNLFQLRKKEDQILKKITADPQKRSLFRLPVRFEISEEDIPLWVDEVKFQRLLQLEAQSAAIQQEIDDLSEFLPLLFGTGDLLEKAVLKTLCFLGLEADLTERGFTADILAETSDGSRKFGFEVTGIAGPVKKQSKKLTQVLDFERIKEQNEKTILIANTHKTTPISERQDLEDFTEPVLDFLGRHPILLLTGWDLYCMVRDVLEGSRTKEEIIEMLYTTDGRLTYE